MAFCPTGKRSRWRFRMCGMGFHCLRSALPALRGRYLPAALWELAASVSWLREHAEEYHLDEKRIVVCGFSAGAPSGGKHRRVLEPEFLAG